MAQRKTITTETVDAGDETPEVEKLEDDVIRALTEIDGADEIRWQVHRISNPNPGFCPPELSTAELTLHRVATDHGPGRYLIKGIKPDGKYFKSARIAIAEPAKKDTSADILAALKKDSGSSDDRTLLLAMMQQSTAIMTAALSRPTPASTEFPWAALLATSPALLLAVKDLFKNTSSDDAMEKLVKQLALVEKLRGDDKKEGSSWTDIIRDALPSLQSMVARPAGAAHGNGQMQPVQARVISGTQSSVSDAASDAAIGVAPINTPEAVEPTIEMMGINWFRAKLEELIQNAAQNKNAELRAEVFADDLPAYIPEKFIIDMLSRDDWFTKLAEFDQRVLPYSGWFTEFRECLIDTLQPDGDSNAESPQSK